MHGYGAPEPGFFLHNRSERLPDITQVKNLVNEQNDAAFEIYSEVAGAFGIAHIEQYESAFNLHSPITRIPPEKKHVDCETLLRGVEARFEAQRISGYVRSKTREMIRQLQERQKWIDTLQKDVEARAPKDEYEYAHILYTLIAGEEPKGSRATVIITPISVHIICREFTNELQIKTSKARTTYNAEGAAQSIRELTREDIDEAMRNGFLGSAVTKVHRLGPDNTVTTGKIPYNSLNPEEDRVVAFETFRHEFDHAIYNLFHDTNNQEDAHVVSKLKSKVSALIEEASKTPNQEKVLREMHITLARLWFYASKAPQRIANEFLSQYGDGGASYAAESAKSNVYISAHLGENSGGQCKAFADRYIDWQIGQRNADASNSLKRKMFDYGGQIEHIHDALIRNAVFACTQLEATGMKRSEVAIRLRFMPLRQWAAYSRREAQRRES